MCPMRSPPASRPIRIGARHIGRGGPPPLRFDFRAHCLGSFELHVGDYDPASAGVGQSQRDAPADATARACDDAALLLDFHIFLRLKLVPHDERLIGVWLAADPHGLGSQHSWIASTPPSRPNPLRL